MTIKEQTWNRNRNNFKIMLNIGLKTRSMGGIWTSDTYKGCIKGAVRGKMNGGISWNLRISGVDWDISEFYLMFLSVEIDIKMRQNYTKTYICKICIRFVVLHRLYSVNKQLIWKQRYPRGAWEVQVCSYYYSSATCHQNSNQWQCSIFVNCLLLYPVTIILHCHWREFWSRDTFWYYFDTVFCQFLKTGRSDKCFTGIVQLLRFSGFSLYPLSFTVPIMLIVFNWSLMQIIQIRLSAVLKENFKFFKCWFFTYWTEN